MSAPSAPKLFLIVPFLSEGTSKCLSDTHSLLLSCSFSIRMWSVLWRAMKRASCKLSLFHCSSPVLWLNFLTSSSSSWEGAHIVFVFSQCPRTVFAVSSPFFFFLPCFLRVFPLFFFFFFWLVAAVVVVVVARNWSTKRRTSSRQTPLTPLMESSPVVCEKF